MMLQDIAPSVLNNQYDVQAVPTDEDLVIIVKSNDILIKRENGIEFPKVSDFTNVDRSELIYAFKVDDERFFLGNFAAGDDCELEGFELCNLKDIREALLQPKKYIFAAYTARHLATWYGNNRCCGRCGHKMKHSDTERAVICPECNNTVYPKIMPAVIVGVANKDKLLITRYKRGYNHNALIAGFTEIGETLEETVSREVMEEAGIRVKNIRYYKSQPWGIAGDILAGFFCEVDGDDTIRMDDNELKYAEWVEKADIVLQPDEASLTNEMMRLFKESK